MAVKTIVMMLLAIAIGCAIADFPDDPKPCKHEDGKCITDFITRLAKEKFGGDKALNLVKIDPLAVNKISIKQGEDSPVNIDLQFTNNEIHGLSQTVAKEIKGFGKDPKGKHEFKLFFPHVELVGDYTIKGKVLILPISGTGKSNITMINSVWTCQFDGVPFEKDGETYMEVKNMKVKIEPERMHYDFSNLFNGDKELGDNMNLFLNENWKEIFEETRISIAKAFAQIFESVSGNVFKKRAYEKYFAE